MEGYTKLSNEAFDILRQNDLSPAEAVAFFLNNIPHRGFKDVFSAYDKGGDLETYIFNGLYDFRTAFRDIYMHQYPKSDPLSRDSLRHIVPKWINGVTVPEKRLDIIGICFLLGMTQDEADDLLLRFSDYGFHLKEPLEIVFMYCFCKGKSIEDSAALIKRIDISVPDYVPGTKEERTDIMEKEFWKNVTDDESLLRFLSENRPSFGRMHYTAFKYFESYYNALSMPETAEVGTKERDKEKAEAKDGNTDVFYDEFRVGQVVAERLRFGLPPTGNVKGYNKFQKSIQENWLSKTSVSSMLKRKMDVSRKALLLLFVAASGSGRSAYLTRTTEHGDIRYDIHAVGSGIDDFDGGIDDFDGEMWSKADDLNPEQSLLNYNTHLNLVLQECGFARLDPRTAFDWLILYSLRMNEADYFVDYSNEEEKHEKGLMSERLENVLNLLFAEDSGIDRHGNL